MRRLLLVLPMAATMAVAGAAGAPAHPPGTGDWFWSPGLCKSELIHYGVELADKRYFRATKVRCFGQLDCIYSRSEKRLMYEHFFVVMLDGNGFVRSMRLHITEKDNYTADNLRLYKTLRWDQMEAIVRKAGTKPVDPDLCEIQ